MASIATFSRMRVSTLSFPFLRRLYYHFFAVLGGQSLGLGIGIWNCNWDWNLWGEFWMHLFAMDCGLQVTELVGFCLLHGKARIVQHHSTEGFEFKAAREGSREHVCIVSVYQDHQVRRAHLSRCSRRSISDHRRQDIGSLKFHRLSDSCL
ncbi:hypothetical protein ES702_02397 [subsurface metagenome]